MTGDEKFTAIILKSLIDWKLQELITDNLNSNGTRALGRFDVGEKK